MNLTEYWNIPAILAEQQEPLARELAAMVQAKIDFMQACYTRELNAKQVEQLNKDVELMGKYGELVELLVMQVSGLAADYVQLCEKQTELIHENNRLKISGLNQIAKELKALQHANSTT